MSSYFLIHKPPKRKAQLTLSLIAQSLLFQTSLAKRTQSPQNNWCLAEKTLSDSLKKILAFKNLLNRNQ